MPTAYLTGEMYGGRPVVMANGYRYYLVSKHKTDFNARRQLRRLDYNGKVRKVGDWWMIIQVLSKPFQGKG